MSVVATEELLRIERRLRDLVEEDYTLAEAVLVAHYIDGLSALYIAPAVELVANVSPLEAKRFVVQVLYPKRPVRHIKRWKS